MINKPVTSMSSRDHTQDGICVSFVWVPMMIIQHFLNVVASAAPNSRGQTVLIITNDDKKGSETKYNPHLYNRRFKWVFFSRRPPVN